MRKGKRREEQKERGEDRLKSSRCTMSQPGSMDHRIAKTTLFFLKFHCISLDFLFFLYFLFHIYTPNFPFRPWECPTCDSRVETWPTWRPHEPFLPGGPIFGRSVEAGKVPYYEILCSSLYDQCHTSRDALYFQTLLSLVVRELQLQAENLHNTNCAFQVLWAFVHHDVDFVHWPVPESFTELLG